MSDPAGTGPGARRVPDVSVIVAVYNTMPYLTRCLTSLVEQTIGHERMEVVAVDDGSTDGSGEELRRFAERFPGLFRVSRQENSGGPAAPSNRALEQAAGRYVFFVGADDWLGPEALERMVTTADTYGADVVYAKMVPVNGRAVPRAPFARTVYDMPLDAWQLPWALSNTKLFRREPIERYGLRFPEDLPSFSDQPFTMEAVFRARKVSVLGDYDHYYAVRRDDAANITLTSGHEARLKALVRIFGVTTRFTEPGPRRDSFNHRHFAWEAQQLLDAGFLTLPEPEQRRIMNGVRSLVVEHLNEPITAKLRLGPRVRLSHAGRGDLDRLRDAIRFEAEHREPAVVVRDGRAYAAYPCFTSGSGTLPDDRYDITERTVARVEGQRTRITGVRWEQQARWGPRELVVTVHSSLPDLLALDPRPVRSSAGEGRIAPLPAGPGRGADEGTQFEVRFPAGLFPVGRTPLRLWTGVLGRDTDIETPSGLGNPQTRGPSGIAVHRWTVLTEPGKALTVARAPIRVRRVVTLRLRRLLAPQRA